MASVLSSPDLVFGLGTVYSWVTSWVWPQYCSWPPKTTATWDLFHGLGIIGLVLVSGWWPHSTLSGPMAQVYRNWALMTGSVSSQPDDSPKQQLRHCPFNINTWHSRVWILASWMLMTWLWSDNTDHNLFFLPVRHLNGRKQFLPFGVE